MGGKRKNKSLSLEIKSAYSGREPLVSVHPSESRTRRTTDDIRKLDNVFTKFFSILQTKQKKNDTRYDLHRRGVYETQTVRLVSSYYEYFQSLGQKSFTMIDAGCGTGKLMRRMLRAMDIMDRIARGELEIRMLGLDRNANALIASSVKRDGMLERNPVLEGHLLIDYLLLDLISLKDLDLKKTVIAEPKVDLILVSDLFYYVNADERMRMICSMRKKLKDSGHLISMEFSNPHVQPGPHLPRKWANSFNSLTEPMVLGELYEMMRTCGFEEIASTFESTNPGIYDLFSPLHSLVFKPK